MFHFRIHYPNHLSLSLSTFNPIKSIAMKTIESIIKIVVVALTLFLVSCEEKIDLSIVNEAPRKLVVDGMITTDTTSHVVKLSYTGGFYLDGQTSRATGAKVVILDDQGNTFNLQEKSPGMYFTETNVFGQVGVEYTLSIDLEGDRYEATSTMQRVTPIDSLLWRWDNFKQSYRILLYGQEPVGKGDFYMWHLEKNGEWLTKQINQILITNDDFSDGNYIQGLEVDYWEMEFNFQPGDTVRVMQHSLTKTAFDFIVGVLTEHNNGQVAMRPPSNVASNISNGALGLFHASAIAQKTVVIK
jgi:hypothetical protein